MYVTHDIQAEIVDLTFFGGHATAEISCIVTNATPFRFDIDQVPNDNRFFDFEQFNDVFADNRRTLLVTNGYGADANLLSVRAVQAGELIEPATFSGFQAIGGMGADPAYNGTFDGSGSAFVAFRTLAGNVGWWRCEFNLMGLYGGGPILLQGGRLGTDGESVVVGEFYTPGDVNMDSAVNLLDVSTFVDRLLNSEFQCEADINLDGVIDLLDVQPFVKLLGG